jgi:hypothetical protein
MKRLFALVLCAMALGAVIASCGGGEAAPKLTIVGAGS